MYKNIPQEMKEVKRWVNWKYEKRGDKLTKIPKNSITGGNASSTNSNTWGDYETALKQAPKHDGIGFVLGDGWVGVDIDNKDKEVQEYKAGKKDNVIGEFIETLGTYAEYSPSGNGIHLIGKGTIPEGKNRRGDFEFYQRGRYFTVTGDIAGKENKVKEFTENVTKLHKKYLKTEDKKQVKQVKQKIQLDLSESEILDKAFNSKNGVKFNDLFNGNYKTYFSSQSEADISFCNMLAFWTNRDINKMDTIFRNSGLYRDKWDSKRGASTYGEDTINKAIADNTEVYTPGYNIKISEKNSAPGKDTKKENDTSNYTTLEGRNKGHASWYEVNDTTGKVKLIPGLLADYLAKNKPAIYTTGRFYIYEDGVYNICDSGEEKTVVMSEIYKHCRTMKQINDIASQWAISENVRTTPEELNRDPYILNLKNGLYYIKEKKLKEHTPKIKSTIRINAEYKEKATGPIFTKFINEVVPDKENLLLVQEILGYSITSFNNAKKIFILDGKGDTGKSTLLNIIEDLLTERNVSNVMLQKLSDRFSTAQLFGKTANIFADLPSTPLKGDSIFKALTGEDKVQAERKGQDPFNFYNKAKLIFSCNGLPENYGDRSDAFYNRLIILPFNHSVPKDKQDPNLGDKLKEELDYILMWAIEGLERLMDNNFIFTENEATRRLVEEYKVNSNSVLLYINEMCEIGEGYFESSRDLYNEYKSYCQENGLMPLKAIKFNREITNNYPGEVFKDDSTRIPHTRIRAFEGIRLLNNIRNI